MSSLLVVTGSLCMIVTLGLSWCLVGVRTSAFMKSLFASYPNLLKAHLDYLMMTGLLMVFFLLFTHFQVAPSPLIVWAMCIGSFLNPVGFILLSLKPDLRQHPASPFGLLMSGSFTLTTIGYAGAALSVGRAALLAL
jgi:hypothetical protein